MKTLPRVRQQQFLHVFSPNLESSPAMQAMTSKRGGSLISPPCILSEPICTRVTCRGPSVIFSKLRFNDNLRVELVGHNEDPALVETSQAFGSIGLAELIRPQ